jgi:2,3-bisphosphoglycerate-independent phosphoglycerate mutase
MAAQMTRPVMLVILDGFGWRENTPDNAVTRARKPNFDRLWATCPHAFLKTFGPSAGLPEGQMGNSEAGHQNIGAGRVVEQDFKRVKDAAADGSIAKVASFGNLVTQLRKTGGTCHLMGLTSPGGVHAHQDNAADLAKVLRAEGISTVVHAFTDGRDTPPKSAIEDLTILGRALPAGVPIATVTGRFFAMDRDKNWDRVAQAYAVMTEARGNRYPDALSAVRAGYEAGQTDENLPASAIGDYAGMRDGDGSLCFNFRADRVREIMTAFLDPAFDGFARPKPIRFAAAVGMTRYSDALAPLMDSILEPVPLPNVLGQVVSDAGRTQLRMAETEKFAHVTFFLNGGREKEYPGEDRYLEPSPKVKTYDQQPAMSAAKLTDKAVAAIGGGKYDLIVLNYANPDMVGHTGKLDAAIAAVEAVDIGLGRLIAAIEAKRGALLVTADHGNAETMYDPISHGPHTAHTTNLVPVLVMGSEAKTIRDGILADVAPTLLSLMGLPQPREMTGTPLFATDAARAAA